MLLFGFFILRTSKQACLASFCVLFFLLFSIFITQLAIELKIIFLLNQTSVPRIVCVTLRRAYDFLTLLQKVLFRKY